MYILFDGLEAASDVPVAPAPASASASAGVAPSDVCRKRCKQKHVHRLVINACRQSQGMGKAADASLLCPMEASGNNGVSQEDAHVGDTETMFQNVEIQYLF